MQCTKKIFDDLIWVGVNDRRLAMFEGVYSVPRGVSSTKYRIATPKRLPSPKNSCIFSPRCPITIIMSVIPSAFRRSTCQRSSGFPATKTMGFGISSFVTFQLF